MANTEFFYKKLEWICNRELHLSVAAPYKRLNENRRRRLTEELGIIKSRGAAFAFLLLYECLTPVAKEFPVAARGPSSSFILWLMRLIHYDPVLLRFPAVFFFGTKDKPRPLCLFFNTPESVRITILNRISAYLRVTLPGELLCSLERYPIVQLRLKTSARKGNCLSWEKGDTAGGSALVISILGEGTHSDEVSGEPDLTLVLYQHPDIEGLFRQIQQTGLYPSHPERDSRIFSLIRLHNTEGMGILGSDYIREHLLQTPPATVQDIIKIINLSMMPPGRFADLQREKLTQGQHVFASREDVYNYLTGKAGMSETDAYDAVTSICKNELDYKDKIVIGRLYLNRNVELLKEAPLGFMFSASHAAEYAWLALSLGWFKVKSMPSLIGDPEVVFRFIF